MITITTATFALQAIAEASAMRIVDCLLAGTLIALLTGTLLRLPPRKSAGLRFAVWFSALIVIAILPWANSVWSNMSGGWFGRLTLARSANAGPTAIGRAVVTLPGEWAVYFSAAWMLIAAAGLLRLGISLWRMRELRKSCVPIDSADLPAQVRAALESHSANAISLCTSDRVQVPTALGLMAPAVVIPHWLMSELSPEELHQIVLHEVAHLHRRDDWTNLAQKVIRAVFFFHPAVWWIEKQLSLEREMACDDAVLATMPTPRAYAECLTRLAEKSFIRRTLTLAQASLGPARQTFLRVSQILDVNRPRETKHGRKWALPVFAGGFAVMAILSGSLIAREPHLLAFDNSAPHIANSTIATVSTSAAPMPAMLTGSRSAQLPPNRSASRSSLIVQTKTLQAKYVGPARSGNRENTQRQVEALRNLFVIEGVNENSQPVQTLVSASNYATAPVTTETIFFFVQRPGDRPGDGSVQPVVEIQWFRLTVFHVAPRSTNREIPKKT